MKTQENSVFFSHFALFSVTLSKQEIFWKMRFSHFFLFLGFPHCAQFQKILMNRFQEKLAKDLRTDQHMDT